MITLATMQGYMPVYTNHVYNIYAMQDVEPASKKLGRRCINVIQNVLYLLGCQRKGAIYTMVFQCLATICDAGPTLSRH